MNEKITASVCRGEGKIGHNNREYSDGKWPKNVDQTLTPNNITIKRMSLEEAYEYLFGEAVRKYDEKQTREDRKIGSSAAYLEKISRSKQQEPFDEIIIQFGDMFTHGIRTGNEEVAKQMLLEAFAEMEKKYPNLFFFNVVVHMDEASPHIHADYIPIAHGYKTGLDTRVAMSRAMEEMGFKPNAKFKTPLEAWQSDTRAVMYDVAVSHGYEVIHTSGKTLHKTVEAYKRDIEQKQREFDALELPEKIDRTPLPLSKDKVIVKKDDLEKLEKAAKITAEERKLIGMMKPIWAELKKNIDRFLERLKGLDRIRERAEKILSGDSFRTLSQKCKDQEDQIRDYQENYISKTRARQQTAVALQGYVSKDKYEKDLDQVYEQGYQDGRNALAKELSRGHDRGFER